MAVGVFLRPGDPIYSGLNPLLASLELIVAYVAIVSGWLGYARSVYKWPHQDTKYGVLRFVTDIAILFCYFGLIEAADPAQDVFRDQFPGWICAVFALYFVSDVFKRQDHKGKSGRSAKNKRLRKSMALTLAFLVIAATLHAINAQTRDAWGDDGGTLYLFVLLFTLAVLLLYRIRKWDVNKSSRRIAAGKRPGGKPPDGGARQARPEGLSSGGKGRVQSV